MKLTSGDNKPREKHIKLEIIQNDRDLYVRDASDFEFNSECTFLQCMLVIITATTNPNENKMVSVNHCQNGTAMISDFEVLSEKS